MIFFIYLIQIKFWLIFLIPGNFPLFCLRTAAGFLRGLVNLTPIRKRIIDNVKSVLSHADAESITGQLFYNASLTIMETICLPFFKSYHFDQVFELVNREEIDKALLRGKGVIFLSMHTGNYECGAMAAAQKGYKLNTIMKSRDDPLFKLLNKVRSTGGINIINVLEQDMYKESLKVLAKNEIIGVMADTGALESRHILHPFLGHTVPIATGWITLAQRSKSAVIPVILKRVGNKNQVVFTEALEITLENRDQMIERIIAIFESFIQRDPGQWCMFLNDYETKRMVQGW
jgi:lauroyl/myristoyl acyltransferase